MPDINYDISSTEQELLEGLKEGTPSAFAAIYDRYFEELYVRAFKILGLREGAEDAVQEIFLALWKYREGLEIRNLGGYLHRSLRNAALRSYQSRKTDTAFFNRLALASNELLTADSLIYKELQNKLIELINALPEDQQKIYLLKREEQMSNREIAERLNISVKTVEKKMTLSLRYIRSELTKAMLVLLIDHLN